MMNIDQNRMQQVAQEAFDKVSGNRRWETAIVKATVQLDSNPYMHFDGQSLLILSPSGEIYSANGTCQCKAFTNGQLLASCGGKTHQAIQRNFALKRNGIGERANAPYPSTPSPSILRKVRAMERITQERAQVAEIVRRFN